MERVVPKLAEGFSEPFPSVLRKTDAPSLTALPAIDRLPHALQDDGVVYIGDAWHPMPPFAGLVWSCCPFGKLPLADQCISLHYAQDDALRV